MTGANLAKVPNSAALGSQHYLVTGASGLLGNNLVRALLATGARVRVLTRASTDPRPLAGLTVERIEGDIRNLADVQHACAGVDVVLHAAGHVHIGWSGQDLHHSINVVGTQNIATVARQARARLVHVSSVNALGLGQLDCPATEETALPGVVPCPYVVSKQQAEEVVRAEIRQGLSAVIVNASFMLGPWDWKPSSGRMLLELATKFVPFAPWGAYSVGDVRDVAQAILVAGGSPALQHDRYILAGHNLTYQAAWHMYAAKGGRTGPNWRAGPLMGWLGSRGGDLWKGITGQEPDLNSAGYRMSNQQHCFSSNRAIAELRYSIRPLQESIDTAWDWFQEHHMAPQK